MKVLIQVLERPRADLHYNAVCFQDHDEMPDPLPDGIYALWEGGSRTSDGMPKTLTCTRKWERTRDPETGDIVERDIDDVIE